MMTGGRVVSDKKTSRDEQAERTRTRILETALELFAARGIKATSTRRIATAAGVSEGLVFHHFPTKRDLVLGIWQGRSGLGREIIQLVSDGHDRPVRGMVRGIAGRFVALLGADTLDARLFQVLLGESRTDPELGALLEETSARLVAALVTYLKARVVAGEVRKDAGCEAAAMNLLGSFVWLYVSGRHRSEAEWREASASYVDDIVDPWLHGALVTRDAR